MKKYEKEAALFCASIKELAEDPDALENLESYLSVHFAVWLEKWGKTPQDIAGELNGFTSINYLPF